MELPTIGVIGTNEGLLLVTDHDGLEHRIPKAGGFYVFDSSNVHVFRLDITHARGEINLRFSSAAEIVTFLAAFDALY